MPVNILEQVTKLLTEAKLKLMDIVVDHTPEVTEAIKSYVANAEGRLSALLTAMASGSDTAFLLNHLQLEKGILESEILSFVVIGKQIVQDVLNSLQDILLTAVKDVLPQGSIDATS